MDQNEGSFFNHFPLSERIRDGFVIAIPTDTLPALAVAPENASKLWEIKKRSHEKPLILMGANSKDLFKNVANSSLKDAYLMAEKYWPGPLTMVLPANGIVVSALNKKDRTIGVRVPACKSALDLFKITGPLATTSANISGIPALTSPKEILDAFPDISILNPVQWTIASGVASTVISWQKEGSWKLLREGSLNLDIDFEK